VTKPIPAGLKGQELEVARELLRTAGFTNVTSENEANKDIPENVVIRSQPAEGQTVPLNQPIVLVVSSGAKSVKVPNLIGLSLEQAQEKATAEGLGEVTRDGRAFSKEYAKGDVISQNPKAGLTVDEGQQIGVVVSNGPEPTTTVPTTTTLPPTTAPTTTLPEESTSTEGDGNGNGNGNGNGGDGNN